MSEGRLTISKVSCGDGGDYVNVVIRDSVSKLSVSAKLSIEEFGQAILGLSRVPVEVDLPTSPDRLGRTREEMEVTAVVEKFRDKEEALAKLRENTPEGWLLSEYVGSKNSFYDDGNGNRCARASAYRWV